MKKEAFGKIDGKEVYKYTLIGAGVSLEVMDFGATIRSLYVDGVNIVQSFETAKDYKVRGGYVCGVIGRVANLKNESNAIFRRLLFEKEYGNKQIYSTAN